MREALRCCETDDGVRPAVFGEGFFAEMAPIAAAGSWLTAADCGQTKNESLPGSEGQALGKKVIWAAKFYLIT